MKNKLMFLLLALFCASSTNYGVKMTEENTDNNSNDEITLEYVDETKKTNSFYPNPHEKNTKEYKKREDKKNVLQNKSSQNISNLNTKENTKEKIIAVNITDEEAKFLKEQSEQPIILTIATFSLIGNAFLGFATSSLNISSLQKVLLLYTANWGLEAWYKSRIKSSQQNTQKNFVNNFGIKLKPYCSSTHWYTALPSYILASAFTQKTMNYLFKK